LQVRHKIALLLHHIGRRAIDERRRCMQLIAAVRKERQITVQPQLLRTRIVESARRLNIVPGAIFTREIGLDVVQARSVDIVRVLNR